MCNGFQEFLSSAKGRYMQSYGNKLGWNTTLFIFEYVEDPDTLCANSILFDYSHTL